MKFTRIILAILFSFSGAQLYAQDEHQHEEGSSAQGDTEEHHEEEGAKNVGPDKGIISFDEHEGFVLSKEALANFDIKSVSVKGKEPWSLPTSALLLTGDEKNMYRLRGNTFKRIDIQIVRKDSNIVQIKSKDLQTGDSIVIQGVGFLRVAELDVTSGESGHSH
jgi:hypothetical protein